MTGVERLLQGRTGFIIAHRLSTVMKADLVAVLDGGRVAELGKPGALLSDRSSRFAALARAQLVPDPSAEKLRLSGNGGLAQSLVTPIRAMRGRRG
jgi:ABC-type multidrug transport system ATPase subunit